MVPVTGWPFEVKVTSVQLSSASVTPFQAASASSAVAWAPMLSDACTVSPFWKSPSESATFARHGGADELPDDDVSAVQPVPSSSGVSNRAESSASVIGPAAVVV